MVAPSASPHGSSAMEDLQMKRRFGQEQIMRMWLEAEGEVCWRS